MDVGGRPKMYEDRKSARLKEAVMSPISTVLAPSSSLSILGMSRAALESPALESSWMYPAS